MTCPRAFEVEAARDGRLADPSQLERHLQICPECSAYANRLQRLGRSLRGLRERRDDELAAQRGRNRLLQAVAAVPDSPARGRGRWIALAGALATATAVYLVIARPAPRPPPEAAKDPIRIDAEHARWSRIDEGTTTTVRLDDGDARIRVDHRPGTRRLVVIVPDGTIEDVGTTFSVRVRAGRTDEIAVEAGRVVFRRGRDAPLVLAAGERWVVHEPVAAAPSAPPPAAAPSTPPPAAAPTPSPRTRSVPPDGPLPLRAPGAPVIERELRGAIAALDAGRVEEASRMLRDILAHHANDPRAEDAAYLLVVALQRASDMDGARDAARDYLRRFPDGFRRASVDPIAR